MKDAQEYFKPYEDLLGFCPPRVQERVRSPLLDELMQDEALHTERLYYEDAYLREFTAQVTGRQTRGGQTAVALDRTAFYATGGGQPNDTGVLGDVPVVDVLAEGGEHCFTRLVVSGPKTNPWFHEADSRNVEPGDLVAIDTDMIGPEGYVADFSRTFLCGEQASVDQKEAYKVAHDFVKECASLIRPGLAFSDFVARCPALPAAYREQAYGVIIHGIGVCSRWNKYPAGIPMARERNMTGSRDRRLASSLIG